jgi:hypothetical protein
VNAITDQYYRWSNKFTTYYSVPDSKITVFGFNGTNLRDDFDEEFNDNMRVVYDCLYDYSEYGHSVL